ncbi:unnamed protein product [Amaranthus hypochondriacus]
MNNPLPQSRFYVMLKAKNDSIFDEAGFISILDLDFSQEASHALPFLPSIPDEMKQQQGQWVLFSIEWLFKQATSINLFFLFDTTRQGGWLRQRSLIIVCGEPVLIL